MWRIILQGTDIDMFLRDMYALNSWNVRVKAAVPYPTLSIQDEWPFFFKPLYQILHPLVNISMI
jgi:hypothetical protein